MGPGLVAEEAPRQPVTSGVRDPGPGHTTSVLGEKIMCPGPLRQGCISSEAGTAVRHQSW